ncbi:MAG: alkaline phosphatase family protein [Cytophagaceae bacterium]|nr:alkaline phosphatase family protein [Cytophagaceae bacterium]
MSRVVVINVVGLTKSLIGNNTPFLKKWMEKKSFQYIRPAFPAVTCTAQANYLTGAFPGGHGIVGNGWYFEDECEVKFWKQSNKLVEAPKIWEILKKKNPSFTCANLFWWYNMYSTVDYAVTPRPQYRADGRKIPDIYTMPANLRDELQNKLGTFPLFDFWGPKAGIKSSQWIAEASKAVEEKHQPNLTLIYLPHLDYNLQRIGPDGKGIEKDLSAIDKVCSDLISFYEKKNCSVIVLSEYGISKVTRPVHLNRVLRSAGYIQIREENGLELLDAGESAAFAVADHQVAHVYVKDQSKISVVKKLLEGTVGVEKVLDEEGKKQYKISHERAGDLVVIADKDSWFTYYYWNDDSKAPDFARTVDIHRKPGYDPVELFLNPQIKFPVPVIGMKLFKKTLGFRTLMDLIPLDASLVKGSHGRIQEDKNEWPVFISDIPASASEIESTEVFQKLLSKF